MESAFHWQDCARPESIHRPLTTDEVADLVQVLHRDVIETGRRYLVRSSHNQFFSHNNLSCTGESDTAIMLDLSSMHVVLSMDMQQSQVTVQAGMTFEVSATPGCTYRSMQEDGISA